MARKLELTPRLRMVADLVPAGARLADVGTDHAYLPAALVLEGKIPSARFGRQIRIYRGDVIEMCHKAG